MCLNKEVSLDSVIDIILEKLESGGSVTFTPNGTSMLPMLRDGMDVVVLKKPTGRLRLYDVPLYRRSNGIYVLHRVIDFGNDGSYVMCGDNQFKREKGITDAQILAVMVAFQRKGKAYSANSIRYRVYISLWQHTRPFRRIIRAIKRKFGIGNKKDNKQKQEHNDQKSAE